MRKENFRTNIVYYQYLNKDKNILKCCKDGGVCYSQLKEYDFKEDNILILFNFHTKETFIYSKPFINKLVKIFDLEIKWINNDKIELTNFKSHFYLKSFVTLFRILFEQLENKPEKNIKILKHYIEDKRKIDLLLKLLNSYNETNFTINCTNHDIRSKENVNFILKTKKDLRNYTPRFGGIHDFFKHVK